MPLANKTLLRKHTANIWKKDAVKEHFHRDPLRGGRCVSVCVSLHVRTRVHLHVFIYCGVKQPFGWLHDDSSVCYKSHPNTSNLHGSTSGWLHVLVNPRMWVTLSDCSPTCVCVYIYKREIILRKWSFYVICKMYCCSLWQNVERLSDTLQSEWMQKEDGHAATLYKHLCYIQLASTKYFLFPLRTHCRPISPLLIGKTKRWC